MKPILVAIIAASIFLVPCKLGKCFFKHPSPKAEHVFKKVYIGTGSGNFTSSAMTAEPDNILHEGILLAKFCANW